MYLSYPVSGMLHIKSFQVDFGVDQAQCVGVLIAGGGQLDVKFDIKVTDTLHALLSQELFQSSARNILTPEHRDTPETPPGRVFADQPAPPPQIRRRRRQKVTPPPEFLVGHAKPGV